MKYAIVPIIILLIACNGSTKKGYYEKAMANAQSMNGIYLFIKCKPINEYLFLGSVDLKWYDKLTDLADQNVKSVIKDITGIINFGDNLENTLKKVREKYPTADGIIFDDEMSRCEVIKFKE